MAEKIVMLRYRKGEGIYSITIPKSFVEVKGWKKGMLFKMTVRDDQIILRYVKRRAK